VPPDAGGALPAQVARLLGVIDSLEKLELICRLQRERDRAHKPAALAAELGTTTDSVAIALNELVGSGLASRDRGGGYWYAPASAEVDGAVTDLIRLYEADQLRILRAMSKAAFDRIRSSAREFADAFVIRKRKPEEPNDG
jgi:hypothetical protein